MRKIINSSAVIYFCFLIVLIMTVSANNSHFEPIDAGAIMQVLHPENPKGQLQYDPHHHYDYIIATVVRWLGYKDNFNDIAWIFWLLDMIFTIWVLIKLCNYLFKKDKITLIVTIMMFILLKSGEIDQKTMVAPVYLLAIYYFLRQKLLLSAIFVALVFYIHVGVALWWFLPSCLALGGIFLSQKRITMKQILAYFFTVIILALPVLFFYLGRTKVSAGDEFSTKYYYYTCWSCSSVLLTLKVSPIKLITLLLMSGVVWIGCIKAKEFKHRVDNVMLIVFGVLGLYMIDLVLADIFHNPSVITLQLLRSKMYIELLASLFTAFLLARQIKNNNYFFFLIFVIASVYSYRIAAIIGINKYDIAMNIFYIALIIYESGDKYIQKIVDKVKLINFKKTLGGANFIFQEPIIIALLFILLAATKTPAIKKSIKLALGKNNNNAAVLTADDYLYRDIAKFTNEKINIKNTLLLYPFLKFDFDYYTKHPTFISYFTPLDYAQYKSNPLKFQHILAVDLNYPVDRFFEDYTDENCQNKWGVLWRNLNEDVILRWKKEYNLTHVIREKDLPLNFPVLYENKFYVIYEIN